MELVPALCNRDSRGYVAGGNLSCGLQSSCLRLVRSFSNKPAFLSRHLKGTPLMRIIPFAAFVLLSLLVTPTTYAASPDRQCVRDANVTARTCARECVSTQEDSLLVCDAGTNQTLALCYKGCSTDKDTCLKPFQDTVKSCSDTCFSTNDAALTACETGACTNGVLECRICKLTSKLARFECASGCVTAFEGTKAARQACRTTFRQCLKTCRKAS